MVRREPGRGLDRLAVADRAAPVVVALDRVLGRHLRRALGDGLRPLLHAQARLEDSVELLLEAEGQVPGLEVLLDVRGVHVRAAAEVAAGGDHEAEGLEVRDPRWTEVRALRRGEAEEELGGL